jgi:tRNA pseudouridine32 synthase/23S rRNA pseudouridine746 synthase/23S rRNA pseudouridine1911/1915/1917 synthase
MEENKNNSKVSKKHQPKGLTILHEDEDIIVIDKSSGLLTMANNSESEKTAYFILTDYVRKGNAKSRNRIFIVHRLDKDTSGVLVFAKTEEAKNFLQENWPKFHKEYFAIVHGKPKEREGIITTYLAENSIHRMYSVEDPELGKLAKTGYKIFKTNKKFTMLKIDLFTGRKNQIRVHMAEMGHPIAGDNMYGEQNDKEIIRLALHAGLMKIIHPKTKEEMTFMADIPTYFKTLTKKVKIQNIG